MVTLSHALRALAGGLLIGLAAAALLYLNGRIAGISGVVGGLVAPARGEIGWRAAFIAGLLAGGAMAYAVAPGAFGESPADVVPLVAAGLLVGFGTRMANGCTSGHGVCGLGRRSPRSLAAVCAFMAVAMVVVFVVRHVRPVTS